MLQGYGIGWQRAAALAGVAAGVVNRLLYGRGGRPPSRRIRPAHDAALRAVQPVPANLAATANVDATGTRRRLQALVAAGWPQRWLSARLGWQPAYVSAVIARRDQVTAGTARAVAAVYDELWDQPPPQRTPAGRVAVTKARRLAQQRGWPLPQAWDDDLIDDPQAAAEEHRRSGRLRSEDLLEEAAELIGEHGCTRRAAAARLGISGPALDKALQRASRRRKPHPPAALPRTSGPAAAGARQGTPDPPPSRPGARRAAPRPGPGRVPCRKTPRAARPKSLRRGTAK